MTNLRDFHQTNNSSSGEDELAKRISDMEKMVHSSFNAHEYHNALVYFQSNFSYENSCDRINLHIKQIELLRAYFTLWEYIRLCPEVEGTVNKNRGDMLKEIELKKEVIMAPSTAMVFYEALTFFQTQSEYRNEERGEVSMHVLQVECLREYFLKVHRYHFEFSNAKEMNPS